MVNGKNPVLDHGCSSLTTFHVAHVANLPLVYSYRRSPKHIANVSDVALRPSVIDTFPPR